MTTYYCEECGEECYVKPLDNSFDYAGTHCTGGRGGTHYPPGYGDPVSSCCEEAVIDEEGNLVEEIDPPDERY